MIFRNSLFFTGILLLTACATAKFSMPEPLASDQPLPQGTSIYGTNTDGCLIKGTEFDLKKYSGLRPAFTDVNTFAHPQLAALMRELDYAYNQRFRRASEVPIAVGDMSRKHGGVILPHHSHQTGLDVDLYFLRTDGNTTNWPNDFVVTDQGVNSQFNMEVNWWLAGFLALNRDVDRIFVAPEVKAAFCTNRGAVRDWQSKETEVLHKLRPWFGHRDHFHVRTACPLGEKWCFSNVPDIPEGDGCDEALTWLNDGHDHTQRKLRTDYSKPSKFNDRCWEPEPNVIGDPEAKRLLEAAQDLEETSSP